MGDIEVGRSIIVISILTAALLLSVVGEVRAVELKVGNRGTEVKQVQQRLSELGYPVGLVDGIFGSKTRDAVRRFQTDKGIDVTGVVNDRTWNALMQGTPSEIDETEQTETEEDESDDFSFDDSEDWEDWAFGESSTSIELGGFIKSSNAFKLMESDERFPVYIVSNNQLYSEAVEPTGRVSLQENHFNLYLKADFPSGFSGYTAFDVVHHSKPDRYFEDDIGFEIDEAYMTYAGSEIMLTVGKEKVVWGVVDVISPFNIINAADLLDPFVNSGLNDAQGQWMIHFNWDKIDKFRLEALVIPIWNASETPSADSWDKTLEETDYWMPPIFSAIPNLIYWENFIYDQSTGQYLDMAFLNTFSGVDEPDKSLETATVAAKVTVPIGGIDLTGHFITCKDPKPTPVIFVEYLLNRTIDFGSFTRNSDILHTDVMQEFSRVITSGISAEMVAGKFRLKMESALTYGHKFFPDITTAEGIQKLFSKVYVVQSDYAVAQETGEKYWSTNNIFGAEYTIPGADIITAAQVGWVHRFGYEEAYFGEGDYINLTLYAQKSFAQNQFTTSTSALIETGSGSMYFSPRLKYTPQYLDFLEFSGGLNLFIGSREEVDNFYVQYSSLLGSYNKYSHVFFTGKVRFDFPL